MQVGNGACDPVPATCAYQPWAANPRTKDCHCFLTCKGFGDFFTSRPPSVKIVLMSFDIQDEDEYEDYLG